MEEAKLVQSATTQIPNPPSSVEAPPSLPPKTKKRPLDSDAHISNSTYFKIRAVLREIRPHVLEVLRTPDFQKCKAANEIQEQVKLLMDLYKQMTAESQKHFPHRDAMMYQKGGFYRVQIPKILGYLQGHQNISFHQVYPTRSSRLKMVKLKGLMLLEDQLLAGTSSPFPAWNQSVMA